MKNSTPAIYLIRHGLTYWNAEKRFQGALNSDLTPRGINQGKALRRILEAELCLPMGEYKVFCSPLGRARQTCDIVFDGLNIDVTVDSRLREITLGDWDGITLAEAEQHFMGRGLSLPFDWHFYGAGGEGFECGKKRAAEWLAQAEELHLPVVAVSHGLIGRILLGLYQNWDYSRTLIQRVSQDAVYKLKNGTVTVLGAVNDSDNWV